MLSKVINLIKVIKVATVTVQGQDGETKDMELKMPQKGTIAKLDGMEGSMVQAGNQLHMLT